MTKTIKFTKTHKVVIWKNAKGEVVGVDLEPKQVRT